jgi:hypothetical protein
MFFKKYKGWNSLYKKMIVWKLTANNTPKKLIREYIE